MSPLINKLATKADSANVNGVSLLLGSRSWTQSRSRFLLSAQAATACALSFPGNGAGPPGTDRSNLGQFRSSGRFGSFLGPLVSHVF